MKYVRQVLYNILYTVGYLHGHTLGQPRTLTRQHTYRLPRLSQNWRIYHQTKMKYWTPSHKMQQRRWTYRKKYIIICKRHTKTLPLVKREQELHESWWELRSESLHESFLNSHVQVKREQELNESWEARVCMRVFSTLMSRSNENKSCMRVDESWEARVCMRVFSTLMSRSNENKSWLDINPRVAKTLFKIWSSSKSTRVGGETRARVAPLINSHPSLTEALVIMFVVLTL
jgi:hypothetical protein